MIPPPHNGKGNAPPPQQQHQQPQWQLYTEQEYQTPYHPQQSYQQQHFHPQDHQFCPIRLPHHHRQQQAPPKQRLKQPKPVLNPERRAQAAVVDADFDGVDDGNGDEREEGVWEGKGEGYGDEDGGDLDDGDNVEGFHDLGNGVEEYGGEHDGDDVDVDDECDDGLGGEPEEVEDSDD
ncbi:hypothetical protein B0T25DRAFT_514786 [Lasiosphaeria hispida]|uniref:Uncharacterized protein n=1 Tax=Lasiosphaeria hispida TaxID=260671 RepID=A0AAJ0HPS4_9PEZI|nr:hypothetical protein B0T25DRAFT_514786 [Lasiosphaeria hispida]